MGQDACGLQIISVREDLSNYFMARGLVLPINFVPERGRILMCDYRIFRVHPEMDKKRRVVVVSPRSYNERHGAGPGRCLVVPFTGTDPGNFLKLADVPFPKGVYKSLTVDTWAICSAAMCLSHARLDRVATNAGYSLEVLSAADMVRIEEGLRHAFGLGAGP